MRFKDYEEQEDMEISEKRMTQLATFIVNCGKHIQGRKSATHVR